MPFPVAAAIAAGASLIGTGANVASTGRQNKKSRQFTREMYERQQADQLKFWETQNAYNTPEQQMERYRQAGLNPNLIYGQGNSGNASPIPTPDIQKPEFRVPDFGGIAQAGNSIANYLDYEIKQAQVDNLRADNTVKLEEALLKNSTRKQVEQNTQRSVFDLDFDTELRDTSAEFRRETLRQIKQNMDLNLNADERAAAQNASSLKESAERILNLRLSRAKTREEIQAIKAAITDTQLSSKLKQFEIELNNLGITKGDPLYFRILSGLLQNYSTSQYEKSGSNYFLESNPQFKNK